MEQLTNLYQSYIEQAEKLRRETNIFASIFSGQSPDSSHPCHMDFYNGVKGWVDSFLEQSYDADMAEQALNVILFSAAEHENSIAMWFLVAAQEHSRRLLAVLPPDRRKLLQKEYDRRYPRRKRLPLQKEIYTLMGK